MDGCSLFLEDTLSASQCSPNNHLAAASCRPGEANNLLFPSVFSQNQVLDSGIDSRPDANSQEFILAFESWTCWAAWM